jgi:hypothetical protein
MKPVKGGQGPVWAVASLIIIILFVFYKIILHSKILLLKVINTIFVGLKKKV